MHCFIVKPDTLQFVPLHDCASLQRYSSWYILSGDRRCRKCAFSAMPFSDIANEVFFERWIIHCKLIIQLSSVTEVQRKHRHTHTPTHEYLTSRNQTHDRKRRYMPYGISVVIWRTTHARPVWWMWQLDYEDAVIMQYGIVLITYDVTWYNDVDGLVHYNIDVTYSMFWHGVSNHYLNSSGLIIMIYENVYQDIKIWTIWKAILSSESAPSPI